MTTKNCSCTPKYLKIQNHSAELIVFYILIGAQFCWGSLTTEIHGMIVPLHCATLGYVLATRKVVGDDKSAVGASQVGLF